MADSQNTESKEQRAAKRQKRNEGRAQRQAVRQQKGRESGRPSRLCSLATVEVKRSNDGFHVTIQAQAGRKSFTVAESEATRILRDLETAIHVIRGEQ